MNQDMSANSATASAQFTSQATQSSIQASQQIMQSQPGAQQYSSQTQQVSRATVQVQQQQQQDTQQVQVQQSTSLVQILPPQQQESQQVQQQSFSAVQQVVYSPPQQAQQETQSTQVTMLKPPTPPVVEIQQQASSGTGLTVSRNPFAYNPLGSINTASMGLSPVQTAPVYQPRLQERVMELDAPQMQIASFGGLGKPGNPLSEMLMQQRFEMMQDNIQQQAGTVNRNVLPNELAGSVDIASIATIPQGFAAYSFMLRDAAFYEPKEMYKNQKTVDNERVLRGLTRGSDRLHQEMIDQQYK
jgi:hypothetical protein